MATSSTIGQVKVTAFVDHAPPPFEPNQFFPDVPTHGWEAHREGLDPDGKFRTNFGFFLLQGPEFTALVDTGAGPGMNGQLPRELHAAGVQEDQIDAVILTHLHADHTGWLVQTSQGDRAQPTFPNADYVISQIEWDHWTDPEVAKHTPDIQERVLPLKDLSSLKLVQGETNVLSGLRTIPTPGHTPGHQSLLIESDGSKGLVAGDILHSAVQVTELDWCAGFDMDKPTARATRRRMIERAAAERMVVAAGHLLLDTNIGHVVEIEGKYRWQPLS